MVGTTYLDKVGILEKNKNFILVFKSGKKGDNIPRHNHVGHEIILTLIKGSIHVFLNYDEEHYLKEGEILRFNGDNYISIDFLDDSKFTVTLVSEK